jgi:hypothetical protein
VPCGATKLRGGRGPQVDVLASSDTAPDVSCPCKRNAKLTKSARYISHYSEEGDKDTGGGEGGGGQDTKTKIFSYKSELRAFHPSEGLRICLRTKTAGN